jgi:hypothetical protein
MWSMHQPEVCTIEKSNEKRTEKNSENAATKTTGKINEGTGGNAPELKPNKSMQTALAALNKLFPITTGKDDGSVDSSDF